MTSLIFLLFLQVAVLGKTCHELLGVTAHASQWASLYLQCAVAGPLRAF